MKDQWSSFGEITNVDSTFCREIFISFNATARDAVVGPMMFIVRSS